MAENWQPIAVGAGSRKYYRKIIDGKQVVKCQYDTEDISNIHFVYISHFLRSLNIRVPEIYEHNHHDGIILQEDIGNDSLRVIKENDKGYLKYYEKALDCLVNLHKNGLNQWQKSNIPIEIRTYDKKMYTWEQINFLENVIKYLNLNLPSSAINDLKNELDVITNCLLKLPKQLIHRDFHSENLFVENQEIIVIDFQGMRIGTGLYDVASLLYDPYANLNHEDIEILSKYYTNKYGKASHLNEVNYLNIAVQRLLFITGVYFSFLNQNDSRYKAYIFITIDKLELLMGDNYPNLNRFLKLIKKTMN